VSFGSLKLLGNEALERSAIVANRRMNRERGLVGGNGYAKDLGLNPLEWLLGELTSASKVSWLDLCCGSGKALVEASLRVRELGLANRVSIVGVDLVPMFVARPPGLDFLRLEEGSVTRWRTAKRFDLITCVHGLH
jgi:SAM-dependent methyltransferase